MLYATSVRITNNLEGIFAKLLLRGRDITNSAGVTNEHYGPGKSTVTALERIFLDMVDKLLINHNKLMLTIRHSSRMENDPNNIPSESRRSTHELWTGHRVLA